MCELAYNGPIVKVEVSETFAVESGAERVFDEDAIVRPRDQWWECVQEDGTAKRVSLLAPFFGLRVRAGERLRRIPASERS